MIVFFQIFTFYGIMLIFMLYVKIWNLDFFFFNLGLPSLLNPYIQGKIPRKWNLMLRFRLN